VDTETGTLFLALLAVAAQLAILTVAVLALVARPTLDRLRAAGTVFASAAPIALAPVR
jgi:hypothetical protein